MFLALHGLDAFVQSCLVVVRAHRDLVAAETLTVDLELVDSGAADPRKDPADDAMKTVAVTVAKADA